MTPSPSSQEEARELKDERLCPACGTALWLRETGAPDDLVSCQCTTVAVEWIERAARLARPTPDLDDVDELVEELRELKKGWVTSKSFSKFIDRVADKLIALRAALNEKGRT